MGFPGTLTFSPPTCEAVLTDICKSLKQHGFERVAIVSGHYGNVWPVANVAETVRDQLDSRSCSSISGDASRLSAGIWPLPGCTRSATVAR